MKKILSISILFFLAYLSFSQSQCFVQIQPSFSSECILTDYSIKEPKPIEEISDCNFVCKNSTVTYTAQGTSGNYDWAVTGATSYTIQGNQIIVNWSNASDGTVSVTLTTEDGNICSSELCVILLEPPEVNSQTTPEYYLTDGQRIINICRNLPINFTNTSTDSEHSIIGHLWTSLYGTVSTENYAITPTQAGTFTVSHTVTNECGCESTETYTVNVEASNLQFDLSCYGAACEGTTRTYTLISPTSCSEYVWMVTNGTIISGQGTSKIEIMWNNSALGYGTICLDGSNCSGICSSLLCVQIPIISDHVEINGADTVCVGDYQIYNVTLWGSTNYTWSINPQINMLPYENANQMLVQFNSVGTYTISVDYKNPFIPCGPFTATPKTVVVLPKLEIITPQQTVCAGDTVTFTTDPNENVNWQLFNENNILIASATSNSFTYIFTNSGDYRVTANNINYCNTASYTITVKPTPPHADTISGPNVSCPYGSITLTSEPTSPEYILLWRSVCQTGEPEYYGEEVSITYIGTVCDVNLYQQDLINGCISEPVTHHVAELIPDSLNIPSPQTVCAGQNVYLAAPNQAPDIMYTWTINPVNSASVQGDNHNFSVTITTNHQNNQPTPYQISVTLGRTYCGSTLSNIVYLIVDDVQAPVINYPDSVCPNVLASFTATGGVSNPNAYNWIFDDNITYTENPISRYFTSTGQHSFVLRYQPVSTCDPIFLNGSIFVNPNPIANVTFDDVNLNMTVTQQINSTYQWSLNGTQISGATNNMVAVTGYGQYCCTVTNSVTGCTASDCLIYDTISGPCINIPMTATAISNTCNIFNITATNPTPNNLNWSIFPYNPLNHVNPVSSQYTTTATFGATGYFQVGGGTTYGGQCYEGAVTVEVNCIPHILKSFVCPDTLYVFDNSEYRAGYTIPNRTITVSSSSATLIQTLNSTTDIASFNLPTGTTPTLYTISMTIGTCTITDTITVYPPPVITSMDIGNVTCERTTILFEASGNFVSQFRWDFGDNSYSYSDSICHTYAPGSYTVTLTATNANGCSTMQTQPIEITSFDIKGKLSATGSIVCMGEARTIVFTPEPTLPVTYEWSTPPTPTGVNTHYVYISGDYYLRVTSGIGCVLETGINVPFYNKPTAKIIGQTTYCKGDSVHFYGNAGGDFSYLWNVTGSQYSYTDTTPNFSFLPTSAGIYTVQLTVSNTHCSDTATLQFTVFDNPTYNLKPAGNQCIDQPPVCVTSDSGYNLQWSNGYFGDTACFYNSGFISAAYTDPVTGCKTRETFFICPKPNFDALLTGCYEFCPENIPATLPVYNIIPQTAGICQNPTFRWFYNNTQISSGYVNPSMNLPINGFGNYYLQINYGDNCVVQSPLLTISETDTCGTGCSSGTGELFCNIKECKYYMDLSVKICNTGQYPATYQQLFVNQGFSVADWSPHPLVLQPGECKIITITVQIQDFSLNYATFILEDTIKHCKLEFSVPIDWHNCVSEGCKFEKFPFTYNESLSTLYQTAYFDFTAILPNGTINLLSIWVEPPIITNYTYTSPQTVTGTFMFDYGLLTQMVANGENICLYAVVCFEYNKLCLVKTCIPAKAFFILIH